MYRINSGTACISQKELGEETSVTFQKKTCHQYDQKYT